MVDFYNLQSDPDLSQNEIDELMFAYLNSKNWIRNDKNPWEWISKWVDDCNRKDLDVDIALQCYEDICNEIEMGDPVWWESETEN